MKSFGLENYGLSLNVAHKAIIGLAVLILVEFSLPCLLLAQSSYTVHALDAVVLDEVQYRTFAKSVTNDVGGSRLVAGYASDSFDLQPVVWVVDSLGNSIHRLLDLPSWQFDGAVAVGINNSGQIIGGGVFSLASGHGLGLYWPDASSPPSVLPGLPGETSCQVQSINDSGIVVGFSHGATGSRAVAWRILADDTIVGPLVLPTRARASTGVDLALAVGTTTGNMTSIVGSSAGAAVAWRVKTIGNSLTLDGSVEVLESTGEVTGINSFGAICGNDRNRSVVWEALSGKKRRKTRLNYNTSLFASPGTPNSITDGGMVVGSGPLKGAPGPAGHRAIIWTSRTAPMRTLESQTNGDYPFLYLDTANSVNSSGEIVGYGWQGSGGGYQAFIAQPRVD
jgi:hypothetical protein